MVGKQKPGTRALRIHNWQLLSDNNNNNNNNLISIALLSYVQGALQSCKQHY